MAFLPYPPTTTSEAIAVFRQDVPILHEVVHGDDTAEVLTENGLIPSVNKAIKDMTDRLGTSVDTVLNSLTIIADFDFTTGGTLEARNQVVLWPVVDGGDGREYRWAGALPKVVPPASTPHTTGGIDSSNWVYIGDIFNPYGVGSIINFPTLNYLISYPNLPILAELNAKVTTTINNTLSGKGGASYTVKTLAQHRIDIDDGAWVPDGTTNASGIVIGGDHYYTEDNSVVVVMDEGSDYWDASFGVIGHSLVAIIDDAPALQLLINRVRKTVTGGTIGGSQPFFTPSSTWYLGSTLNCIDLRVDLNWQGGTMRPLTAITCVNYETVGAEFKNLYIRHSHLNREDVYLGQNPAIVFSGGQPINVNSESVAFKMARVLIYDAYEGFVLRSTGSAGGLMWQFIFENCMAWDSMERGWHIESLTQTSTTGHLMGCHTKCVTTSRVQHNGKVWQALQHMLSSAPVEPEVTVGWEDYWRVLEVSNGVNKVPTTEPAWVSGTFYRTNGKGYYINNVGSMVLTNCSSDGGNNREAGNILWTLNNDVIIDTFHYEGGNLQFADNAPFIFNSNFHFNTLNMYDLRLQLPNPTDRVPLISATLDRARVGEFNDIVNQAQNVVRKGAFDLVECASATGINFNAVKAGVGVNPELFTGTDKIAYFKSDREVTDYRKNDVNFVMTDPTAYYKLYEVVVPAIGAPVATYLELNDTLIVTVNSGNNPANPYGKQAIVRVSTFVQSGPVTPDKSYHDVNMIGDGNFIYSTFNTTTRLLEVFARCTAAGQVASINMRGTNSGFSGTPYKFGSVSRLLAAPLAVAGATVIAQEGFVGLGASSIILEDTASHIISNSVKSVDIICKGDATITLPTSPRVDATYTLNCVDATGSVTVSTNGGADDHNITFLDGTVDTDFIISGQARVKLLRVTANTYLEVL